MAASPKPTPKPRNDNGRPPHKPTENQRAIVKAMAGYGVPTADIAAVIGVGVDTIRKHYFEIIRTAAIEANAAVAQSMFSMATKGRNVQAATFWLKSRAKWRDVTTLEHTGEDGAPMTYVVRAPAPIESAKEWLKLHAPDESEDQS